MRQRERAARRRVFGAALSFWDHNETGLYYYRQQCYDVAIAEFERAVGAARVPLAVLYVNLGAAYLRNGRCAEARACLERGLTIDPDNQRGHWFLGQALKATAPWFEALAEFERTYALDPDSPEGRAAGEEIGRLRAP